MKITMDAADFTNVISWAARYAASRPLMPVMAGVLLDTAADILTARAGDGDTWATATGAATTVDAGRVLLPARLLADIAGKLPDAPVEIVVDGSETTLTCGSLTLTIPAMAAEDYPVPATLPAPLGELDADVLSDALKRVTVAAGRDGTVPGLQCVYLESVDDDGPTGGALRMSATDKYRVARTSVALRPASGHDEGIAILVPAATMSDLAKTASGQVTLHARHDSGVLGVSWPGRQVTTRLIGGTPPAYDRAIAGLVPVTHLDVDRARLVDALDRVAVVYESGKALPRLLLELAPGQLDIRVVVKERGRAREQVAAVYDGERRAMQCNAHYLADAVKAAGGDVIRIGLTVEDKNAMVLGSDADPAYVHVIMMLKDVAGVKS